MVTVAKGGVVTMGSILHLSVAGAHHEVSHLRLYPALGVNEWRSLINRAQAQLGGVNLGIGFIGSPEWVIGGSIVTGLIGSALNNAAQKIGMDLLNQAATLLERVRQQQTYFAIEDIQNRELPHPKAWMARGLGKRRVELDRLSKTARQELITTHNITQKDVVGGAVAVPAEVDFIMSDDEFVGARTHAGEALIRWSSVDFYQVRTD